MPLTGQRSALFGHMARLRERTPAQRALKLAVSATMARVPPSHITILEAILELATYFWLLMLSILHNYAWDL